MKLAKNLEDNYEIHSTHIIYYIFFDVVKMLLTITIKGKICPVLHHMIELSRHNVRIDGLMQERRNCDC